jgi:hypothetical protein
MSGPYAAVITEPLQCCETRNRDCSRFFERDARRLRHQTVLVRAGVLSERTWRGAEHFVADLDERHPWSNCNDDPGDVRARH